MTNSGSQQPGITLKLLRAGKIIRTYRARGDSVTIGSEEGCTIRVAGDSRLAPKHATLYTDDEGLTIVAEPGAEVFVNGKPVDFALPAPTDIIKTGRLSFHAELAQVSSEAGSANRAAVSGAPRVSTPSGSVPTPSQAPLRTPPASSPPKVATPSAAPPKVATPSAAPPQAATPTPAPPKVATPSAAPPQAATPSSPPPEASFESATPSDDFGDAYFGIVEEQPQDELFFEEPFDLAVALIERKDKSKTGKLESYLVAHVVRVHAGRVTGASSVLPRKKYVSNTGEVKCRVRKRAAVILVKDYMKGEIYRGEFVDGLSGTPNKGGYLRVDLKEGERAMLAGKEGTYQVDVYRPPASPKLPAFRPSPRMMMTAAVALVVHAVVGVAVAALGIGEKEKEVQAEEEVFADVEIKEPEKKAEEIVQPQKRKKDTLSMSEKAPKVSNKHIKRIRDNKESSAETVNSLLNVLQRGSGKAGKTGELKDLVSNIDAVANSGAGGSFDIAGAIASLPGDGVNIAREGGGGIVSTLSGEDVAGKGTGIGKLAKKKRSGKVRGKVSKMSSGAKVGGSLSRADVLRVINGNMHAVQACYERALMSDPAISGRLTFDWTVNTKGRVKNVRVRSSSLGNQKVTKCISSLIKRWKFPRPKGGDAVITFPFLFRAVN